MDFSYTASGSLFLGGCSGYNKIIPIHPLFAVGDILYSYQKAIHGIYEKVCIKRINPYIVYVDTFNAVWMQDELITPEQAMMLVDDYLSLQDAARKQAALDCLI